MRIIEVTTLVGNKNLQFSSFCLKSFVQCCVDDIHLTIFDDGSLNDADKLYLQNEIPGSQVISKTERDHIVNDLCSQFPRCARFRSENILGQKLVDVLLLKSNILFIDSDVLFFKNFRLPEFNAPTFIKDVQNAYVFHPIFQKEKFKVFPKINTGFFYFPFMDSALVKLEGFLQNEDLRKDIERIPGWAEQSLWALLAGFFGTTQYFSETQIAMAGTGSTQPMPVAIHLVSTYRDKFSFYKQFCNKDHGAAIELSLTSTTRKLPLIAYRLERLRKRVKHFLNK